jgi:hypothetical protein
MRVKLHLDNKIQFEIHKEDRYLLDKYEDGIHLVGTYFRLTYMSKFNPITKYLLYFLIKKENNYTIFPILYPIIYFDINEDNIPLISNKLRELFNNMKLSPKLRITQILYEISNLQISDKIYLNFMFSNFENIIKALIREYYPYFDYNNYITLSDIIMEYQNNQ